MERVAFITTINYPFGINAYARELVYESFKQDWNLQDAFVSLGHNQKSKL